jgi:hypothetical protein
LQKPHTSKVTLSKLPEFLKSLQYKNQLQYIPELLITEVTFVEVLSMPILRN